MGRRIFSLKMVAVSAAVLSTAVALRLATPPLTELLAVEAPRLYRSIAAWLCPPYLYLIINGIIISIAATSRFNKTGASDSHLTAFDPELISEEEFMISRSDFSAISRSSASPDGGLHKPSVLSRLGHRRTARASPEGKALRVARPKKQETLEGTWRMITDGRAVPLIRHLKKADTWDTHPRTPDSPIRKSETIASSDVSSPLASGRSPPGVKLRREPSIGQDDINRRVEAFIKRFNEEMRLERQESLQKYMEMIGHSGR